MIQQMNGMNDTKTHRSKMMALQLTSYASIELVYLLNIMSTRSCAPLSHSIQSTWIHHLLGCHFHFSNLWARHSTANGTLWVTHSLGQHSASALSQTDNTHTRTHTTSHTSHRDSCCCCCYCWQAVIVHFYFDRNNVTPLLVLFSFTISSFRYSFAPFDANIKRTMTRTIIIMYVGYNRRRLLRLLLLMLTTRRSVRVTSLIHVSYYWNRLPIYVNLNIVVVSVAVLPLMPLFGKFAVFHTSCDLQEHGHFGWLLYAANSMFVILAGTYKVSQNPITSLNKSNSFRKKIVGLFQLLRLVRKVPLASFFKHLFRPG